MKIPNPKAKSGDKVMVLNYRCKPPKWDEGEYRGAQYQDGFSTKFYWQYDVYIGRGKGFFLHVGDDKIRQIK